MQDEYKVRIHSNKELQSMIKKNVMQRQALKKKWDRNCKYDAELPQGQIDFAGKATDADINKANDNYVRLLDEGVVIEGDGSVYAVIKKGVIKKWYDQLPDDFVGNIDKDHNRSIDLGVFRKSDLKLVKLDDERYGVDVNVQLDDELYATRDLKRMGNRKAISSEFYSEQNEFVKQSVITGSKKSVYGFDYLVPLIDEIQITGYAVVDSPKNANSYDEDLLTKASTEKEVTTMTKEELKKLAAEGDEEAKAKLAELEADDATDDVEESTAGDPEEQADEETTDDQTDASAGPGYEGESTDDAETEDGEAETEDAADEEDKSEEEVAEKFETAIKELRAQIAEKDAKIAELEAKLSAKTKSKNAFLAKLESALDFTTAVEPGEDEGNADTTPEKTEGDEIADEYAAAFKDLN